jgi:nucleoid-associated protein YgaU
MGIFGKDNEIDDQNKGKQQADFSDVQSGSSSTAPPPGQGGPAGTVAPMTTYVVVKGDSLSRIAQRAYGDGGKWRKIYEANKDIIKDPDLIYPGQSLHIPE